MKSNINVYLWALLRVEGKLVINVAVININTATKVHGYNVNCPWELIIISYNEVSLCSQACCVQWVTSRPQISGRCWQIAVSQKLLWVIKIDNGTL